MKHLTNALKWLFSDGPNNEHWNFDIDASSVKVQTTSQTTTVVATSQHVEAEYLPSGRSTKWQHQLHIES